MPCADEASKRLKAAGFQKLSERNPWKGLKTGGKYYFTRNASTIVAFAVGSKYAAGNGFHMIGAHTDRYGQHICHVLRTESVMQIKIMLCSHDSAGRGRKHSIWLQINK